MILREHVERRVRETVEQAASRVKEQPELLERPEFIHETARQICASGNGRQPPKPECMSAALAGAVGGVLTGMVLRGEIQKDQLTAALTAYQDQVAEQPRPARILSRSFPFGADGRARQMLWVQPIGAPGSPPLPVCLADAGGPAVEPLSLCYIDAAGKFYLQPADDVPLSCEESTVVRVDERGSFDLADVVIRDGPDRQPVLKCRRDVAEAISGQIASGQKVTVRHDHCVVIRVVDSQAATPESWLEFPELDGPTFDELVFPGWLRSLWKKNIRRMARGRPVMLLCYGPTGVGKSETALRVGRDAANRASRPLAFIRFSLGRMGSSYWTQTEQNVVAVRERAIQLAREGYLVVILGDEADGVLGNSDNRYESATARSVRNTFQSEFSKPLGPYCSVILTMNIRKDSWLPAPLQRRFKKIIFPPAALGQVARIAAGYSDSEAMEILGTTAEEFGQQLADFLFADRFRIARVHMHSGDQFFVTARDLRDMSPGRVESLVKELNEDVLDGELTSLGAFWPVLDREFRSTPLSESNLYELTYLDPPANDTVRKVEMLQGGTPELAVQFVDAG